MNRILTVIILLLATVSLTAQQSCGTVTDYDGNTYKTVKVGSQCWMAENLRVMHFADGTKISRGTAPDQNTPLRYYPGNDMKNTAEYGMLYNWLAASRACPKGWHLPSDNEWKQMEETVGDLYGCNGEVDDNGKALAAAKGWKNSSGSCHVGWKQHNNNASGFSALPAGNFNKEGAGGFGEVAYSWTATEMNTEVAVCRYLGYNMTNQMRVVNGGKGRGFSVRCVRD